MVTLVVKKQIKETCKMIENNKITGDDNKHVNSKDNKNYLDSSVC